MGIACLDGPALGGVLAAQFLVLLTPGANQLSLCCASSVSLRHGLRGAAILAVVVAGLASVAAGFGQTLADQGWLLQRWLGAGAAYLGYLGMRRLAAAARGRVQHGDGESDLRHIALTALSNPFSLAFYVSIVTPVVAAHDGSGFAVMAVVAMTALAASVYGGFAILFSSPPVRRLLERRRRVTDGLVGLCLLVLAARLSAHLLPV